MDVARKIRSKRIALRLHIEQMKVTAESLKNRARRQSADALAYQTARAAHERLLEKVEQAERELSTLERNWKC